MFSSYEPHLLRSDSRPRVVDFLKDIYKQESDNYLRDSVGIETSPNGESHVPLALNLIMRHNRCTRTDPRFHSSRAFEIFSLGKSVRWMGAKDEAILISAIIDYMSIFLRL